MSFRLVNPITRFSAALTLAFGWLAVPLLPAAPAPPDSPRDAAESYLADWARSLADELDVGAIALPSEAEMRDLGRQFDAYFATGSFDDIAWILPEARQVLTVCNAMPELKPYADWLRQRMDYLELASKLVQWYPPEKLLPPMPRPNPLARFTLPKPPPPPPVTAAMLAKREAAARSREVWKKTLADRPIPEAGIKLVPMMKKVFEDEGLPHQLVWMAEVESTFNPKARSPAGAAGLFQFMPDTAERLGLRTAPVDQRQLPEPSARAAARYLRYLYEAFGSWPLALAGYNAGEGRVDRALKKTDKPSFDAIAAALPLETRLYVSKVLSLIELREKMNASKLAPPRSAKP